ncbi:zinc dependent phospholipase C family protein [Candidatus Bathyarchaeota archaeon]|nr:zinc dependent phospholipase C family protein [Candidatus Bathyarchaeota archaeon]
MPKKRCVLPAILILSSLLLVLGNVTIVWGWSNGGFSDNPAKPDYGTHDWIAEHALDWLPQEEKQFILDNNSSYLYGTELPDNWQASDGIGDTFNHHVYYYSNYSLQDNASAVRAQEEYNNAFAYFKAGNLTAATKSLGAMTHYISDLAVFAHVMGAKTDWGNDNETLHDRYEDYVNTRTNSYEDEFSSFLDFDGALANVSAYDAALTLAYNTTFGVNGNYTCKWMNENYNWSIPAFTIRCGELLNLAVNLIADVLHTFYLEAVIPEFPPGLVLPIFMILLAFIVITIKKKLKPNRLFH